MPDLAELPSWADANWEITPVDHDPFAPNWQDVEASQNLAAQTPSSSGISDIYQGIKGLPHRLAEALYGPKSNTPILTPVDHDPFAGLSADDQAAMMPETFANPAVKSAIEGVASIPQRAVEGAQTYSATGDPTQVVAPATDAALMMMGSGLPMAERGAAGAFGGKLAKEAEGISRGAKATAERTEGAAAPAMAGPSMFDLTPVDHDPFAERL